MPKKTEAARKKARSKKVTKKTTTKKKVAAKKVGRKKKSVKFDGNVASLGDILGKEFEIQVMDETSKIKTPYRIPFKHKALQAITGGLPGGHFTEIVGVSQSGKSFLLYELGCSVIDAGGYFFLHDVEKAYEPAYGRKVGLVNAKSFILSEEKKMERIFTSSRKFINSIREYDKDCPILIGIDSYPPIQTFISVKEIEEQVAKGAKEFKGYKEAKKNAIFATLIGEFVTYLAEQKATLVLINQSRKKMNVMFGDDHTANAENIIQYYATLRIRGRLGAKITDKEGNKRIGVKSSWETIKNRDVPPWKIAETKIIYKTGIDPYHGLRELLTMEGIGENVVRKPDSIKYKGKVWKIKRLVSKKPEVLDLSES